MTASSTPDQDRRLAAKRSDERVKLIVTSLNAIALAVFATAVVMPAITKVAVLLSPIPWVLPILAAALHSAAHGVLRFLRREE